MLHSRFLFFSITLHFMKLTRKQKFRKPPVIKRNPARTDYFHQKENPIESSVLPLKSNQTKSFEMHSNKGQVKTSDSHSPPVKDDQVESADLSPQKNWWIHLWSGLVLDRRAKHKRAIRQAIWLYLYFLLVANRGNGKLYRKLSTIAGETGFNPRSIQRWLYTLREKGYIESHSTGRYLEISITKWKPISRRVKAKFPTGKEQIGSIPSSNFSSHNEQFKRVYRKTSQ